MNDDDWMNPPSSIGWSSADIDKERKERPWIIQRCRRVPVTGNVSSIDEWGFWSSHETKQARDNELRKLRQAHSWVLRPASYGPLGMLQVDEDEDMILARAEAIKARRALST